MQELNISLKEAEEKIEDMREEKVNIVKEIDQMNDKNKTL